MKRIAMMALVGALMLGACSPATPVNQNLTPEPQDNQQVVDTPVPPAATATPVEVVEQPTATAVEPTSTPVEPTEEATKEPTVTPEPPPDPTEQPAELVPKRTPRPELEATDPANVKLVSGRVQLVEFFAFW